MLIARTLGTATATVKHPSMEGQKLLLVQPLMADRETPDGDPQLVIDHFGADRGSIIVLTSDGRHTREVLGCDKTPVRWCVLGIADE